MTEKESRAVMPSKTRFRMLLALSIIAIGAALFLSGTREGAVEKKYFYRYLATPWEKNAAASTHKLKRAAMDACKNGADVTPLLCDFYAGFEEKPIEKGVSKMTKRALADRLALIADCYRTQAAELNAAGRAAEAGRMSAAADRLSLLLKEKGGGVF